MALAQLFRRSPAWVLALTLWGSPSLGWGFCRTTTIPVAPDYDASEKGCWTQGVPLWWRNSCVSYSLQQDASRYVNYETAADIVSRAFAKWTSGTCRTDGSGSSRTSIDVRDLGGVLCRKIEYNRTGPNQNVIVFRDKEWPHKDRSTTLALTIVSYNTRTGEITDADMEVNSFDKVLTTEDPVPPNGTDFESVITHEAGHFLGIAHSDFPRATMFARYDPGSTLMRNLSTDDIAGICTVYSANGLRSVGLSVDPSGFVNGAPCDPTPRGGLTRVCKSDLTVPGQGCALTPALPGTSSAPLLVHGAWASAGLAFWARRRRRPRSRP